MAGPFETAARAAIEDLIKTHATSSKFGYLLTEDGFDQLTSDLFSLLQTSRTLKSAGDRFLAGGGAPRRGSEALVVKPKPR
jgi:hypothetical protein